jgi:hypothetical protein
VIICQQLQIRYLWIDAICIIQDSEEDWQSESAQMLNVYGNAYLTLMAASAEDENAPILTSRNSSECDADLHQLNLTIGRENCHFIVTNRGYVENEPDYLQDRAWCFQEEIISTRKLYIFANQINWICLETTWSEGYHGLDDLPDSSWSEEFHSLDDWLDSDPRSLQRLYNSVMSTSIAKPELGRMISVWNEVVQQYTARELTKPSDKLVALSGIANAFNQGRTDQYLAGIFREHLPCALLWQRSKKKWNKTHTEYLGPLGYLSAPLDGKYRAPSWTWASLDGRIDMLHAAPHLAKPLCVVVEASTSLALRDPYGQILDGHLKIEGRLIRATVGEPRSTPEAFSNWGLERELLDKDGVPIHQPESREVKILGPYGDVTYSNIIAPTIFHPDCEPPDKETTVYCLPIMARMGLVLVPIQNNGSSESSFRRIGVYELFKTRNAPDVPLEKLPNDLDLLGWYIHPLSPRAWLKDAQECTIVIR